MSGHSNWASRPQGRTSSGSRWRKIARSVLARSTVCIVCDHGGADAVDHVLSVREHPELEWDVTNLAPIHHKPCVVCSLSAVALGNKPVRCNYIKGYGSLERAKQIVDVRTGKRAGAPPEPVPEPADDGDWW